MAKRKIRQEDDPSKIVADLYIRSSKVRPNEREKKVSPKVQEQIGKEFIRSQGWTLGEIYRDIDKSAFAIHYTKREGLMAHLERAREGKSQRLVIYKFTRFGRKWFDEICDKFEDHGCYVVSATENIDTSTPGGRAFRSNYGIWARFQSEDMSEWLQDTKQTNAELGKFNGGNDFYGAIWNKEKRQFENNLNTAPIILSLFKKAAQGYGSSYCMKLLHDTPENFGHYSNIKSPTGKEWWQETTLTYLWSNARYIGLIPHNGLYYGGEYIEEQVVLNDVIYKDWLDYLIRGHGIPRAEAEQKLLEGKSRHRIIPDPIINIPLWNEVQKQLEKNKQYSSAHKSSKHEFTGLIFDGKDGQPYQYRKQDQAHPARWICAVRKRRGVTACNSKLLDHDTFLQKILQQIYMIALDQELWAEIKKQYIAQIKKTSHSITDKNKLEKEINKLENVISEIEIDRYERRILSAEQFTRLNSKYQADLEKIQTQYLQLINPVTTDKAVATINKLKANLFNIKQAWNDLDFKEKRMALQNIIKLITVHENKVTIDFTFYQLDMKPTEIRKNVMYF